MRFLPWGSLHGVINQFSYLLVPFNHYDQQKHFFFFPHISGFPLGDSSTPLGTTVLVYSKLSLFFKSVRVVSITLKVSLFVWQPNFFLFGRYFVRFLLVL